MSRQQLEQAHELIIRKQYEEARVILESLQAQSSTARRWLANLDEILQDRREAQALGSVGAVADERDSGAMLSTSSVGTDETLIADAFTFDGRQRWEYREVVVKMWQQHMSNIDYVLEQGGEQITIDDAYTRLLNENGAEGWEVISEEVLPQQFVRLLMKRPVQS
jgi:hypothetical protein